MDFDLHFTKEDEAFRQEVRKWLEANVPKELDWPRDPEDVPEDLANFRHELINKLGVKGWYAPDWPKEYGGGGLDEQKVAVLRQEFNRLNKGQLLGFVYSPYVTPVLEFGTEEQKRELIPPLLRADTTWWLNETEPDHGTDNAAMETLAVRDGDSWVINGEKIYVGNVVPADWSIVRLFTPVVIKPGAPRHENLGVFVIPANLPGIRIERMKLIGAEDKKHRLYFENCRVPNKMLIGGPEARGWDVLQASLRSEHGGGGNVVAPESLASAVIDYCKKTKRNGKPISSDPLAQEILVKEWIDGEIERLYVLATYWTGKPKEWTGRSLLLSCHGAWHGLSTGALALMGDTEHRRGFGPLLADAMQIPFGDVAALDEACRCHRPAALFVEPIQSEGGIRVPATG